MKVRTLFARFAKSLVPGMILALCLTFASPLKASESITLWHSYRGDEAAALTDLIRQWNAAHPDNQVEPLNIPFGAFGQKLSSAIPHGNGPDLFIAAHERLGDYLRNRLIEPFPKKSSFDLLMPRCADAMTADGVVYGIPLAYKSLALFYNRAIIASAPQRFSDLIASAAPFSDPSKGAYGLAYEAASAYHHIPFLYGFGGSLFDDDGLPMLATKPNARSMAFVYDLVNRQHLVPEESTGTLVTQLFNDGKAAFVINGPWFLGEINRNIDFAVAPLPVIDETGKPMQPFLTVEGIFRAAGGRSDGRDTEFAYYLIETPQARHRAEAGHQNVATMTIESLSDTVPEVYRQSYAQFRKQADTAIVTPTVASMRLIWEPLAQALRRVLRGAAQPAGALQQSQTRLAALMRPTPNPANPLPYWLLLGAMMIAALWWARRSIRQPGFGTRLKKGKAAYVYVAPTAIALGALLFMPFVVGSAVSLFAHRGGEFTFVGLKNFWSILSCADYGLTDPMSFYFTLVVTVLWTAINVVLHVGIGMALAMLLREPWLKLRSIYRVLLIVPWAVPNYITALIWKGMFNKQFGAINALLGLLGIEPVSWFSQFSTAFAANITTNTWLGFPFMMVVTLGALQAIPKDLEEAAFVDGATGWQRFRHVTLPLLKPALLPAVILGSVWTFNMFNIIYLVSGGEPDGATEILISESYKWAFERNEQYGYAAAYAVLIFIVLLLFNAFNKRVLSPSSEEAK